MKYRPLTGVGLVIFAGLVLSSVLLYGQAPLTIPAPIASPGVVVVNTPTPVIFTIDLSKTPSAIATGVTLLRLYSPTAVGIVATMRDDGKKGDAVAGDKIFTAVLNMNQAQAATLVFQVSIAFPGQLKRVLSPVLQFAALAPTTLPVVLPPDPGPAGKLTIAGIDSDHDGIRDDVYRSIVFASPDSERKREGMKQLAKSFQTFLLATSQADAIAADNAMGQADACNSVLNATTAPAIFDQLKTFVINTDDRLRAYYTTQSLEGVTFGQSYTNPCSFNPAAMSN